MKNFAGNLYVYCEELYNANKDLIELLGLDCIDDRLQMERVFLRICCSLMRLVPCNKRNKEQKFALDYGDSVLLFQNDLSFLKQDYDTLFENHCSLLEDIKNVRDKTEHCPHKLEFKSADSGSLMLPRICFKVQGEEKEWRLSSKSLMCLTGDLNMIFNKIIKELRIYICTHHTEKQNYPYYQKIIQLDYERFNRLFASDLLKDISKVMQSF